VFPRLRLGALVLVGAALAAPTDATTATTDGGVAWTVQTADNTQGTGRANFTYDVARGAVISDAMIVVNTGTEPLPLSVYAADAFTASTGEIDVLVGGQPSQGAGTWVSVTPTPLTLDPATPRRCPSPSPFPPTRVRATTPRGS
jgi:hypothetical protein